LKFIHIRTHLLDHARAIIPRRVRQLWQSCILSRSDVRLHRINAGGVYAQEHFTRPGLWRRHLFQSQNFGASKFTNSNSSHCLSSSRLSRSQLVVLHAPLKLARVPRSLAATRRGFTFYVADPVSSIPSFLGS